MTKRQFTPLGKITVIKTFAVSKIIHLFIHLPDLPDLFLHDLEAGLFHFLWDGKQSRIKKSVVCKLYEEGGLKMFDVSSYLAAVKISLLRIISCPDSNVMYMHPECVNLRRFGGKYPTVLMQSIQNKYPTVLMQNIQNKYPTVLMQSVQNKYPTVLMQSIQNPFWRNAFEHCE